MIVSTRRHLIRLGLALLGGVAAGLVTYFVTPLAVSVPLVFQELTLERVETKTFTIQKQLLAASGYADSKQAIILGSPKVGGRCSALRIAVDGAKVTFTPIHRGAAGQSCALGTVHVEAGKAEPGDDLKAGDALTLPLSAAVPEHGVLAVAQQIVAGSLSGMAAQDGDLLGNKDVSCPVHAFDHLDFAAPEMALTRLMIKGLPGARAGVAALLEAEGPTLASVGNPTDTVVPRNCRREFWQAKAIWIAAAFGAAMTFVFEVVLAEVWRWRKKSRKKKDPPPQQSAATAIVLLFALFVTVTFAACGTSRLIPTTLPARAGATSALVIGASLDCHQKPTSLRRFVVETGSVLRQRLVERLGSDAVTSLDEPTAAQVLGAIERLAPGRSLLIVYSGHGRKLAGSPWEESHLCLRDGPLAVSSLLEKVPASAKGAALFLDGCESAWVDVRAAEAPTSVISASPAVVFVHEATQTPLGSALAVAVGKSDDLDHDGWISDDDLFSAMLGPLLRPLLEAKPFPTLPKLRRQAPAPILLYPASVAGSAPPEDKLPAAGSPQLVRARFSTDWELASLGPPHLRVTGEVPRAGMIELSGQVFDAAKLRPVPCGESTGQCFVVAEPVRSGK